MLEGIIKTVTKRSYGITYTSQIDFTDADVETVCTYAAITAADRDHLRKFNLSSMSEGLQAERKKELKALDGTTVVKTFTEIASAEAAGGFESARKRRDIALQAGDTDAARLAQLQMESSLNADEVRIAARKAVLNDIKKAK